MTRPGRTPRLGEFLRARRALVRPEAHGIPSGQRRTPGLRRRRSRRAGRAEHRLLHPAGTRTRTTSPNVINALAHALLLDDQASAYLNSLAQPGPCRPPRAPGPEHAAAGLVTLLNAWPATPALVYGRSMDLLATNPLAEALFSWLGEETNLLRAIFLKPAARVFYQYWARIAEGCVAALRAENPIPTPPN